jgi:hypothetical protein
MSATSTTIARIATSAAQQAALPWFKLGALHRFTGHGIEGDHADGVMLTFKFPASNQSMLVHRLLTILRVVNATQEACAYYGSLIDEGMYAVLIVPRTAAHADSQEPVNPARASERVQGVIKWENLPMIVGELEAFLRTPQAQACMLHDDEQLEDYELDSDPHGSGELEFYIWLTSPSHRSTIKYILTVDTQHKPLSLLRVTEAHECPACYHEQREEDRLWQRPI